MELPITLFAVTVRTLDPETGKDVIKLWRHGDTVPGFEGAGTVDKDGKPVPGTEGKEELKIAGLYEDGDAIEVFAAPVAGSSMHVNQQAVRFRLAGSTIVQSITILRHDIWEEQWRVSRQDKSLAAVADFVQKWTGVEAEETVEFLAAATSEDDGEVEISPTASTVPAAAIAEANGSASS